jgi:hypothetical protein
VLFLASNDSSYVHDCSNMHLNRILTQDALIRLPKEY